MWMTGLREIARVHVGNFRLTPNQNLVIANVPASARTQIDQLVGKYDLDLYQRASQVHRDALACVALPTCPLAMAEAERYLPELSGRIEDLLQKHGLGDFPINVRATGCPNGCARPFLAEIALVGKALGRYNLHLGGDARGQRLNVLYRENIDATVIFTELDTLIERFARDRQGSERFGDFLWRAGLLPVKAAA
jgi:sulfite reductase (NADPH) hemoprotein beta-component